MIEKELIVNIVNESLVNGKLFLVDVKITKDNKISVIIDGDEGVSIENCISLSKEIEKRLDRDREDFELQVLSSGVGEKLVLKRQYKKNTGRQIQIKTEDETVEGELVSANEEFVEVRFKRNKVEQIQKIDYKEIIESRITVIF